MTINATAAILLLLYELVADEHGRRSDVARRHHPERHLEGVRRPGDLHLPAPPVHAAHHRHLLVLRRAPAQLEHHLHLRATTSAKRVPRPCRRSPSRSPTASPTSRRRSRPGSTSTTSLRGCFFWNAHNNLFEEVAKYRAARRMWAKIMTERFGASDERSKLLRFHTQTGGSTLTAQQPENNIVRVTLQALAAVLGGTQSLHTNGFDEALGLPTTNAAKIALRTQQIIGLRVGGGRHRRPPGGVVLRRGAHRRGRAGAWAYLERIDNLGGAVAAIEAGFMQGEIEQAAYATPRPSTTARRSWWASTVSSTTMREPAEVFPIDSGASSGPRSSAPGSVRGRAGPGGGRRRAGRCRGGGPRHAEPPRPHARGAAAHGDAGRGLGRAAPRSSASTSRGADTGR